MLFHCLDIYPILLIHSAIDGHLSFHFWHSKYAVTMNNAVYKALCGHDVSVSLGYIPQGEIAGSYELPNFSFKSGFTIL